MAAAEAVHEVPSLDGHRVEAAGRTDGAIVRDLLTASGVPGEVADARWPEVQRTAVEAYAELCPADLSDRVAPGIPELLAVLAERREEFRLSLVTGNLEAVARLKLERAAVVGDTPRDVACARADGLRVAAVATGPFAPAALAGADVVVDDARALLGVLEDWL
jgi:phosphoglycolate phosphatase-like HAD superfamily hydrolase